MVLLCDGYTDRLRIEDGKLLATLVAQLLVLKFGDHIDAESLAIINGRAG